MLEITYVKISHVYINNKLISENLFEINDNLDENVIFKFFGLVTNLIDIKSGQTKKDCSKTTLEVMKIKKY